MQKVLFILSIAFAIVSCKSKTTTTTNGTTTTPNTSIAAAEQPKPAKEGLPTASRSTLSIDQEQPIIIDGTKVGSITGKNAKKELVSTHYYVQQQNDDITITEVEVTRGDKVKIVRNVFLLSATQIDTADVSIETIEKGIVGNDALIYMVTIGCGGGTNCIAHTSYETGIANPLERTDSQTQLSFETKEVGEKYQRIFQQIRK